MNLARNIRESLPTGLAYRLLCLKAGRHHALKVISDGLMRHWFRQMGA